jgi:hypothetical protein
MISATVGRVLNQHRWEVREGVTELAGAGMLWLGDVLRLCSAFWGRGGPMVWDRNETKRNGCAMHGVVEKRLVGWVGAGRR